MKRLLALSACLVGCGGPPASTPPAPPPGDSTPPLAATTPAATASGETPADAPEAAPAKKPGPPDKPQNVLLILVDSMRADMPWAGYERDIAPNLTALEKESVSYTQAYSTSSYTAKSVAALLSGQYPSSLKRSGYFFAKYPESNVFFPELLDKAGYYNIAVHGHMYMRPGGNGMDQGFDSWQVVEGISFDNKTDKHVTSDKLTPLAIELLKKQPKDAPFFAYLHYMDPHDVYVKHEGVPDFGKKLRDRYDGEVFYTDIWIGKLLEFCKAQPWWKDTVVMVSADHGEAFGEHKMFRHGFELWNEVTRVPMFIKAPGASPRRIDTPRVNLDLAKTVLEFAKVPPDPVMQGQSLVAEVYGAEAKLRPVLLDLPADSNNPERRAFVVGQYKLYIYGNDWKIDLYDLAADPGETKNIAKQSPEKVEELTAMYKEMWAKIPKVKPFGNNKLKGGGVANGPAN